jgi:YceI-like domain
LLTKRIQLASLPADGTRVTVPATGTLTLRGVTVPATGTLTLRGVTRTVSIELAVHRSASTIKVAGSIPVPLADYGIPNPSFGGITTEDHGEVEYLRHLHPALKPFRLSSLTKELTRVARARPPERSWS